MSESETTVHGRDDKDGDVLAHALGNRVRVADFQVWMHDDRDVDDCAAAIEVRDPVRVDVRRRDDLGDLSEHSVDVFLDLFVRPHLLLAQELAAHFRAVRGTCKCVSVAR